MSYKINLTGKKYLIAAGDSWTDPYFKSDFHPSLDCSYPKWPEILAERLNLTAVNTGRCGAGNIGIYGQVLDEIMQYEPEQIGLVLVGWSKAERSDWERVKKLSSRGRACKKGEASTQFGFVWENRTVDLEGNFHSHIRRSHRMYYSLQCLCNYLNIPFYQFQMIKPFTNHVFAPDRFSRFKKSHTVDERAISMHYKFDEEEWNSPKWTQKLFKDALQYTFEELLTTWRTTDVFEKIDAERFLNWPVLHKIGGIGSLDQIMEEYEKAHCCKMRISNIDQHPNREGQVWIADWLQNYVSE